MSDGDGVRLRQLGAEEMGLVTGGTSPPNGGPDAADYIARWVVSLLQCFGSPPASSYAYGKVGYTS